MSLTQARTNSKYVNVDQLTGLLANESRSSTFSPMAEFASRATSSLRLDSMNPKCKSWMRSLPTSGSSWKPPQVVSVDPYGSRLGIVPDPLILASTINHINGNVWTFGEPFKPVC